jgi:EAL domain-containing protein (putative c-di-GMP-specific phosphodiesterase class I)
MGVKISIDDFGTGYSSLAYLGQLPVNKLKIDQSFVRKLPADRAAAAITTTIIALAKNLDLAVIAEGVETEEQAGFLRERECDEAQGYLYSRPVTPGEIETLMSSVERHTKDRAKAAV